MRVQETSRLTLNRLTLALKRWRLASDRPQSLTGSRSAEVRAYWKQTAYLFLGGVVKDRSDTNLGASPARHEGFFIARCRCTTGAAVCGVFL